MKHLIIHSLLGLSLVFCLSCRNNQLRTNEEELVKEILALEKEKNETERTAIEYESSETVNNSAGSFREKEIRSVDPQRPPLILDILGTRSNTLNFRLSDVASSIKYVKLQTPPDTSLLYDPFFSRSELTSTVKSDGEQIIYQGVFGLSRFNMQGDYQETIWKNKTGISIYHGGFSIYGQDFFGVEASYPFSLRDGNIYFPFIDGPAGNSHFMKYKPGTETKISLQSLAEIPGQGTVPGDTLLSTDIPVWDRFEYVFGIGSEVWAGVNSKWNAGKSGSLLITYNNKGDTLCQFTDYDRIVNYNKSSYRRPVDFESYYYNGQLTIKQEYNDTVFRLIPPNRLLPSYIIDFGEFKVNYMDGLDPNFDLAGKYMFYSLFETNDFLFIRYTQNSDSPYNRTSNVVKFFNVLYDKRQGKLYHHPDFTLKPEGIKNDIDGGIPFWPDFITPQGEMMKLVSGKVMKEYINSMEFKEAAISEGDRQKQISIASGLKNTDMIILMVN